MTRVPTLGLPYTVGVKLTIKLVPSLPYGSNSPLFGWQVNSVAEPSVKNAVNSDCCLMWLVRRKETLDVFWRGDWMTMMSSTMGSEASKITLNFQRPPLLL